MENNNYENQNQSRSLTKEDKNRIHNYILNQNVDEMTLTLSEIEEVIGHRLAQSYYDRNIWCYEDKPIYKVIVGAGYSVVERFYDEDYILIRRSNQLPPVEIITANQNQIVNNINYKIIYPNELQMTRYLQDLVEHGIDLDNNNLVELSRNNSDIVERLIPLKYRPNAKACFDSYCVNGNFVMTQEAFRNVCYKINSDNSTRVSREHVNIFVDFIMNPEKNFLSRLESGDIKLVDEMDSYVRELTGRRYKSLASKICKYLNEFLYNRHDYYINDYFVRTMLPYYLNKYNIKHNLNNIDNLTYKQLYDWLKKINSHCRDLNPSELDHIMWFCYRAN